MRDANEREKTMSIQLPAPIARYVQIANSGTAEAASECFAPDANVYDEGRTYQGLAAIKDWMAATKKNYGHTVTPLEFAEHGDQSVLKARLAGNFTGSPITVNFSFVLAGGKIRSLEIRS
jgi:SnoaL-like domain